MNTRSAGRLGTAMAAVALVSALFAQTPASGRIFTYDGSAQTNGTIAFDINGANYAPVAPVTNGNNSVSNTSPAGASFGLNLDISVATFILVSGSLDGTYAANGYGVGADDFRYNDVEIRTNRNLTVLAGGFTKLVGDKGPSSSGSVLYTISAYEGFPMAEDAVQIAQSDSASDDAFNGKSLVIPLGAIPASGKVTLRMGRRLKLDSTAQGSDTLRAHGTLILTVS